MKKNWEYPRYKLTRKKPHHHRTEQTISRMKALFGTGEFTVLDLINNGWERTAAYKVLRDMTRSGYIEPLDAPPHQNYPHIWDASPTVELHGICPITGM